MILSTFPFLFHSNMGDPFNLEDIIVNSTSSDSGQPVIPIGKRHNESSRWYVFDSVLAKVEYVYCIGKYRSNQRSGDFKSLI